MTPNGFIRFADGKMKKLDAASGLPCDGAVNVQDDEEGSKWFYMHCLESASPVDCLIRWRVQGQISSTAALPRPPMESFGQRIAMTFNLLIANIYP